MMRYGAKLPDPKLAGYAAGLRNSQTCKHDWPTGQDWIDWFQGWKEGQRDRRDAEARRLAAAQAERERERAERRAPERSFEEWRRAYLESLTA